MRKKRNDFDAVGAERMTDTELSKKLGSYQRMESIGILLGVILVITGCIMMFVYRNLMVICILVFTGVALFLLVAKPAQNEEKSVDAASSWAAIFRAELTKAFGPEPEPATLPIDWAYLDGGKAVGGLFYGVYRDGLSRGRAQGAAVFRCQRGAAPHGRRNAPAPTTTTG